jgi:S-adenosylmethionine uptake transporter
LIGFVGVIIAVRGAPSTEASPLHAYGVAAVLYSTVMFSVAMVMLRDRAKRDGPIIVGLLSSLMPGLILAVPAIALAPPPHWEQWWAFLLMGVFAAVFMYLIARAYAHAEAQQLAPIHYTELLWATLVGYVVFHEMPRVQIFLGAGLIVAACLYAAYEERRLTLKPEPLHEQHG